MRKEGNKGKSNASIEFLFGLLFGREDGGIMFLRNIGKHSAVYTIQLTRSAVFIVKFWSTSGLKHAYYILSACFFLCVCFTAEVDNPAIMTECQ
jgi:hypothetical protein